MTESVTALISMGVNFGALGIIFFLFVSGQLHANGEYKELREDLATERKAHDLTRQALTLASERAQSSLLTSELVLRALYPERNKSGEAGG